MEIYWEGQRESGRMSGPGDRQDLGTAEGGGGPLAGPLRPRGRSLGCVGYRGLPGRRPMAPMAVDMSVFRCIPGGVTTHFPLSRSSAYSGGSSIPRALAMYSGQVSMEERCGLFPPLLSPWQITEPPSLYHEETSWSSKYFQCLLLVCPVEKVPACHSNTAS